MSRDASALTNSIVSDLFKKVKPTVSNEDWDMLTKVKIVDVGQAFESESLSKAKTDQERWDALITFLAGREEGKRKAERERVATLQAEKDAADKKIRDAKEAEEKKIREAQDAMKRAEEAAIAKKKADEDAKAAAEAKKKADAEAAAAAKKKAEEEARAAAAALAEAKAKAVRERRERDKEKAVVPKPCRGCGDYITDTKYMESEDDDGTAMFLHSAGPPYPDDFAGKTCMELYESNECPVCDHCGAICNGDYVSITRASDQSLKATVHEYCSDGFKKQELEKSK